VEAALVFFLRSPATKKLKIKKFNFYLFLVFLFGTGGPAELREVACDQKTKKKKKKKKTKNTIIFLFLFYFYFILFYFIFLLQA
jgi:hypothetical protein